MLEFHKFLATAGCIVVSTSLILACGGGVSLSSLKREAECEKDLFCVVEVYGEPTMPPSSAYSDGLIEATE